VECDAMSVGHSKLDLLATVASDYGG
jgi:hypothetical protein